RRFAGGLAVLAAAADVLLAVEDRGGVLVGRRGFARGRLLLGRGRGLFCLGGRFGGGSRRRNLLWGRLCGRRLGHRRRIRGRFRRGRLHLGGSSLRLLVLLPARLL